VGGKSEFTGIDFRKQLIDLSVHLYLHCKNGHLTNAFATILFLNYKNIRFPSRST